MTRNEMLLAVADEIEAHPENFNMTQWCGTACCIAGHVVKLFGISTSDAAEVRQQAIDILGLTGEEGYNLFLAHWTNTNFSEITARETVTYLRKTYGWSKGCGTDG